MTFRRPMMVVALWIVSSHALAAEPESPLGRMLPEVHAFASQGFMLTSENNYLVKSKAGSFELSEIGINFTEQVTERLRFGLQLFAHKPATGSSYDAKMDWFYLDYRFADWLGFRAGRTKVPFGLYNEINDVDAARVPILLPQSIYSHQNRDFLLAQTGFELYGRLDLRSAGMLDYRAYAGTIFLDVVPTAGSPFQVQDLRVPYLVGGRLMWETPVEGLRLGGSAQVLRLNTKLLQAANVFEYDIPAVLAVSSVEYSANDLLLAAEYSRWFVKADSSRPDLFPSTPETVSERAYAMASYRVTPWLQPGAYYSLYFTDVDHREGRAKRQHDIATTLRFDFNDHWLLKLEGHYMAGTAALSPALNDNVALSALPNTWVAFLATTTAYF